MSSMIISSHLYEKRPLKKPKLGPPDVYPQDPKQKEDELTAINVKQGYCSSSAVQDEYGTARNSNITSNRFGEYFSAILSKKQELNILGDTSRKKHQINKDSTLYVTPKNKSIVDNWFKDLATSSKSLATLSRKVPVFNKKDEIFVTLYEFSVPLIKAEWVIKMTCAHQMAMSESNNKSKKRQMPDPSQEWSSFICKFLKEHYFRISESINSSNSSSLGMHLQPPQDTEELLKQWNYYTSLARQMYDDGLLDRHEFLTWMIELFEKIKSIDDSMLNLIVPLLIQYVDEFTLSEFLSRRLAYYSSKKINQLVMEFNIELHSSNETDKENQNSTAEKSSSANSTPTKTSADSSISSSLIVNGLVNANVLKNCYLEITSCTRHRNILFSLCSIVQVITLDCPTALIWLNASTPFSHDSSSKHSSSSPFHGSPLDFLPCEPSSLPMPLSEHNARLRCHLRIGEDLIRRRSRMSEKRWFFQIFGSINSSKSVGKVVNRLLGVLEYLDKHLFDKVSSSNSVDSLYNKIFHPLHQHNDHHSACHYSNTQNGDGGSSDLHSGNSKSNDELIEGDLAIVRLLCEWAVTTKRLGEYRSRVVAKLLERRQSEFFSEKELNQGEINVTTATTEPSKMEVDESPSTEKLQSAIVNSPPSSRPSTCLQSETYCTPIYQNILFDFLDTYAPIYEDKTFNIFSANSFGSSNVANTSTDSKQAFNNLILLFSELIRNEVFSHDAYMCTLISRGHFSNPPNTALVSSTNSNQSSKNGNDDLYTSLVPSLSNIDSVSNGGIMSATLHKSTSSSSLPMFDPLSNNSTFNTNEQSSGTWPSMSNDNLDEDVDDDLDKILQQIKGGQAGLHETDLLADAMESDKEDDAHGPNSSGNNNNTNPTSLSDLPGVAKNASSNDQGSNFYRHMLYTLHFPLPQDEFFIHEGNQRHILLYGVGKTKDEARHSVKKVTKEIQKLFNRKSSLDISDGGKVKKHAIREGFNFENALAKFQNLSIFDQHVVTNSCVSTVLEMLNGVVIGSANHLPLIESIAFLFDLMEIALNVHGLIEFLVQMLKELVEVEIQLQQKCPSLARPYCTSMGLYIVGVLYRYHSYMIVSTEDIVTIFDLLWKLVRNVVSPSDCASAERCIFYYIYDLYSSCSYILKKYHDCISPIISKIKAMALSGQSESNNTYVLNASCNMLEYLKNPKLNVDPNYIRQLNENSSERYSLVFTTIRCIVETNDMDQLNEMSVLCAELTSLCSQLSNDWFNAFQVLFNPKKHNEYSTLLSHINIGDRSIYDNLAVFILVLVARRCFSLEELFPQVLIPSLLLIATDQSEEAERCALLSCHLILCLFKYYDTPLTVSNSAMNSSFASSSRYSLTSPGPLGLPAVTPSSTCGQKPPFVIKYAPDRYLLGGALNSLRMEAIVTSLKAIFFIGTQTQMDKKLNVDKSFKSEKTELNFNEILKPISNDDDLSEMGLLGQMPSKPKMDSMDKPSLPDFAKHVVRQICLQDWVHDRCLRSLICSPDIFKLMFDKRLSHKDAQHLLNMICNHKQMVPGTYVSEKCDSKQIISRVFQNLDEWSIRHSWLQLHLIYEQLSASSLSHSSPEVTAWLDTLARAVVDYFQNTSQVEPILDSKQLTLFTSKSSTTKSTITHGLNFGNTSNQYNSERIWLVVSLVSKLPSQLQSKILRVSAGIFDSNNWILFSQAQSSSMSSKSKSGFQGQKNSNSQNGIHLNNQNPTSALLSYQPFISLILMCLGQKEDCKDAIAAVLSSMHLQISQCINEKLSNDIRVKHSVQEGLQLRLSLVGAMYEVIQTSNSLTSEWCILLLQLIIYAIVDPHINYENFTTVLDILTSLMHTTQVSVPLEQREENKKHHQNLVKKLKKELNNERIGVGLRMAKQLLPIVKLQTEVIACEPMGSLVDTKGNKIVGFDSIDKKAGLQVSEKQKLSPWDLLEGHKNPAPLGWTWFGAMRIERKPMRMEENFCLMARHNHSIRKPTSYYLEAPPLPPEEDPAPVPPPLMPNPASMQSLPFTNATIGPTNGPNLTMQGSPLLNNLPPPNAQFNSSNLMHTLPSQPSPHTLSSNYNSPHMHHMQGMTTNSLPHTIAQGPPSAGSMHGNSMTPGSQPHLMATGGNELSMGQPGHHIMPNSHLNNSIMSNMALDSRELLLDGLAPGNAVPIQGAPMQSAVMQSAPMQNVPMQSPAMQPSAMGGLRATLNAVPPVSMNPVNVPVVGRAATPKATKPKAPRRRRTNAKNPAANGNTTPVQGQQTPPIRMNSFDGFNQTSVNNQIGQPVVGQPNNWPFQQQVASQQAPPSANMPGQPVSNAPNQNFYQQAGPPGPAQSGPAMMQPQAQQVRFNEGTHPPPSSKVRLRAMLNTRHPNTNQFNMPPNAPVPVVPTNTINSGPMMNNNGNMMASGIYQHQTRPQIPMQMQPRQQMRPQGQMAQATPPMAPMSNQNAIFQQQQMNQATNTGSMMHHMQQQQSQPSNFSGAPQAMSAFNPNAMSNLDNSGMQIGGNGPPFQGQPQQQGIMMRPQMQIAAQQPTNPGQFMQQRSQYNNGPIGQTGQMSQMPFGQQQQQQIGPNQQMMNSGQHWPQQQSQMQRPQMTQLQRQLSSNQGPPPPQGQYHQVPY